MDKLKVYLAKSNRADPNKVSQVRTFLQKFDNITIREFEGGAYSNTMLKDSDLLVVVATNLPVVGESVRLGRGIADQIRDFRRSRTRSSPIDGLYPVFVTGIATRSIQVAKISSLKVINPGGFIHHASGTISNQEQDLRAIIEHAAIDKRSTETLRQLYKAANFGYHYGQNQMSFHDLVNKNKDKSTVYDNTVEQWRYKLIDLETDPLTSLPENITQEEKKKLLIRPK